MWLYHVSSKYLGRKPTFHPRIPISAIGTNESKIPRICFCPKVADCLIALECDLTEISNGKWYVYRIYHEQSTPADKSVPDRRITRERWICESVQLEYAGYIQGSLVKKYAGRCHTTDKARERKQLRHVVKKFMPKRIKEVAK